MVMTNTLARALVARPATSGFGLSPKTLLDMFAVARQRRALLRLDDAALRDMGLTREQALLEAGRPAWDLPASWR